LFFMKVTKDEHSDWIKRMFMANAEEFENMKWEKKREEQILQVKKRRNATERKQKQCTTTKKCEVLEGLHSPGGTKIKVSHLMFNQKVI